MGLQKWHREWKKQQQLLEKELQERQELELVLDPE
jgi:hypothetical protein